MILGSAWSPSSSQGATQIFIYGDAFLDYQGTLDLPSFNLAGKLYSGFGQHVFWNKDAGALVVIEKVDTAAAAASSYGVAAISPTVQTQTPFTIDGRGGASRTSLGAGALTNVGSARVKTISGSGSPSGLAIFGSRQNGVNLTASFGRASQLRLRSISQTRPAPVPLPLLQRFRLMGSSPHFSISRHSMRDRRSWAPSHLRRILPLRQSLCEGIAMNVQICCGRLCRCSRSPILMVHRFFRPSPTGVGGQLSSFSSIQRIPFLTERCSFSHKDRSGLSRRRL